MKRWWQGYSTCPLSLMLETNGRRTSVLQLGFFCSTFGTYTSHITKHEQILYVSRWIYTEHAHITIITHLFLLIYLFKNSSNSMDPMKNIKRTITQKIFKSSKNILHKKCISSHSFLLFSISSIIISSPSTKNSYKKYPSFGNILCLLLITINF